MSDPTDGFPFNPDLYRLLAQMYGVGLFTPSPAPRWSDPSLALPPGSDLPGFDKSPAVLEALSAADPRPPGFYRSTALLGARALLPTPVPNLPSTIGQQAMLFGGPGAIPTLPPLPAPWSDYVRAAYTRDLSQASTPDSGTPGFDKSPAVLEALSAADPRPPGFYRSTALLGTRALMPTPDPGLPSTIDQQALLFGGPGATSMLPPLPAPWSDYVRARYMPDSSLASNTGAPVGPDPVSNPLASLPIGGPQSVSPASNPYLIPVRADSTPMTGPQAISRPVGEPPAQSVDPSDIFARAGLPRPLPMSVPTSPPASSATDDRGGANSGGSLAFLGPVGAAIRSAAVPAAEAVAAMGVGPLLAALASGAAVLFYPSEIGDDSCTPPNCNNQYAIRGGMAAPKNLQDGVAVVKGFEPMTGFSVTSAPNMTLDQLARYAQYPNAMISFTTTQELARMGYPVASTPQFRQYPDPLHSTVQTPMPLPDAEAQAISGAFRQKMRNLYQSKPESGPKRNLSVLDER